MSAVSTFDLGDRAKRFFEQLSLSRYFGRVQNYRLIARKPENSTLLRKKNINEIIINHIRTWMVEDGED